VYAKIVGRSVPPASAERVEDVTEIVAEVLDQRRDSRGKVPEDALEPVALLAVDVVERVADDLLGGAEETLVELVRHLVDPAAQELAPLPGVGLAQPAPVLELEHLPPGGAELVFELMRLDDRDDAIEALAVEIDDPEHVREPASLRLEHRLPEISLIELGIAEHRDEAPAGACPKCVSDVAVRERPNRGAPEPILTELSSSRPKGPSCGGYD
jgi:hypothetical protein